MRRFSQRFVVPDTVTYFNMVATKTAQGGVKKTYPDPGVVLDAAVEPHAMQRLEPDGTVRTVTAYKVFLLDSPDSLNGGIGISEDDAFEWKGKRLISQGAAASEGGINKLWRCDCLEVE